MNLSPTRRRYLYRLGLALIALATAYGLLSDNLAAAWALILAPLFGLADANVVPPNTPHEVPDVQ